MGCLNLCSGSFHRHFVPNLTIGASVIQSLRKHRKAYLDCQLMVSNPLDYIKSKGMKPDVALKPATPIEDVYPLLVGENPVEAVLVMTVEPGFGGQKFMPEMMDKVHERLFFIPILLFHLLISTAHKCGFQVDGGLESSTIDVAASAGAKCIIAGSSVFGASEPAQVISLMKKSVEADSQ
ncbi:aldolase-type TIM barrel family protein [Actinidia rufa]|uniref:Aldolase-type TIM barrel family protein n=1 Tax=Actinidia rufa TaxID=165716 RepID=A0A7J0EBZ1_9ERIC|nr:aldolase-type TIM barrel family protein [Actinidia rufa]